MTKTLTASIRDSKAARWGALGIVSFTMMGAYFFNYVMSPLKQILEEQNGWSSSDYGFFTGAYGWLNVFALMLFFGGLILDKKGVRFTGILSTFLMVFGSIINFYAMAVPSLGDHLIFGINSQVMIAAIGFAIFGVGCEVTGITVSKVIVRWFKGHEMATAMGLQVALARIGTGMALIFALPLAVHFKEVSAPVAVGGLAMCLGLLAFVVYTFMDRKLEKEQVKTTEEELEEKFKMSDVGFILKNKGFWLIALLCVMFYSCVFPFLNYSNDLLVNKFHVDGKLAGLISSLLPFGTVLFTPLFGGIYDKKGKGATIMIIGAILILFVHIIFTIPFLNNWMLAVVLMIILGIGFSLVPSAMWPSVAKIIPEKQLGSAYSLIFLIQNIGLMGVPYLIGTVLERYCKSIGADGKPAYDYTLVMAIFSGFALISIFVAFALKREDKKKGYGLEQKNAVED